eukprot:g42865.t1
MASSCKAKDRRVCLPIITFWCSDVMTLVSYCSLNLEYPTVNCHPYYLWQEFTSAILTAVYIPLHVEVKSALDEICNATNSLGMEYPEALFIVAIDFNQANFISVLPKYHQHVSCPTRDLNILVHCYTIMKDADHSILCLHFGKSGHKAVLLLLAYKQKLKQEDLKVSEMMTPTPTALGIPASTVSATDLIGPDGVPSHVVRSCADQTTGIFTDIFNLSLLQCEVPACFKQTINIRSTKAKSGNVP